MTAILRRKVFRLRTPKRTIVLGRHTLVMGVLNVTPDSFSDGGEHFDRDAAIARAIAMEAAGAHIIDVGGESTRPGSSGISVAEELRRIIPVLEGLRGVLRIPISVDTSKSEVAEAAIRAGAEIVNDVTGLRADPTLALVARRAKTPLILMHMRGEPATMQTKPFARDVMSDVRKGFMRSVAVARKAGVPRSQIALDPGIGFGKSGGQNCELIARLAELAKLGFPLMVGTSRKGFIGKTLGSSETNERMWGTAATVTASILHGAHIVRVHDVAEMAQVARMTDAIADLDLVEPKRSRS